MRERCRAPRGDRYALHTCYARYAVRPGATTNRTRLLHVFREHTSRAKQAEGLDASEAAAFFRELGVHFGHLELQAALPLVPPLAYTCCICYRRSSSKRTLLLPCPLRPLRPLQAVFLEMDTRRDGVISETELKHWHLGHISRSLKSFAADPSPSARGLLQWLGNCPLSFYDLNVWGAVTVVGSELARHSQG